MQLGIELVNCPDAEMHGSRCEAFLMQPLGSGRAAERYRMLVEQLLEEDAVAQGKPRPGPYARGGQTRVAKLLGVEQPHLSKICGGGLEPTIDVIELAMERTRIAAPFFFGSFVKDPHYRDFRGPIRMLPHMGYPALRRFYDSNGLGMGPTEQEKHLLERQEWEGEPTEGTYALFLQALRTVKGAEVTQVRTRSSPSAAKSKARAQD